MVGSPSKLRPICERTELGCSGWRERRSRYATASEEDGCSSGWVGCEDSETEWIECGRPKGAEEVERVRTCGPRAEGGGEADVSGTHIELCR